MQLDFTELPVIWMREHEEGQVHNDAEDREQLLAVLQRGQRFVLIADRMPTLPDLSEMDAQERKVRAKMFKVYRQDLARLCRGMILIGRAAAMPLAIKKTIEGFSSAMGVALLFAESEPAARELARSRLAEA
ncbi:hypothetical protein FY150_24985 (plasmid) [Agrobacterium tumefaciens]|nr:hypothetical protein FY150_24985 [Agrobacterium tumefaciens]